MVDLKERPIDIDYSFAININFKIAKNVGNINQEINLISICFSNNQKLNLDLKLPGNLVIPDIKKESIKKFLEDKWNNLIITIADINNSLNLYINLNGENETTEFKITNLSINLDDKINKIELFNNFVGEVSSIYMFTQTDPGTTNIITPQFLSELKNYKQGLWKKKIIINNFLNFVKSMPSIDYKTKSIYLKGLKLEKKEEKNYMII